MGNYNCICVCKGDDWPYNTSLKGVNSSPLMPYSDNVNIDSSSVNDISKNVPLPQQATNKHGDDDKLGTRELTDADDKSQASVGSTRSSVLVQAEEENPENVIHRSVVVWGWTCT